MVLLFEWECPYCQNKFYSSCADRDQENVECCDCGKKVENPYYDKEE